MKPYFRIIAVLAVGLVVGWVSAGIVIWRCFGAVSDKWLFGNHTKQIMSDVDNLTALRGGDISGVTVNLEEDLSREVCCLAVGFSKETLATQEGLRALTAAASYRLKHPYKTENAEQDRLVDELLAKALSTNGTPAPKPAKQDSGKSLGPQKGANARPQAAARAYPTRLDQLLAPTPTNIAQHDFALLNLLCAEGLRGAEDLDVRECLATLDRWAERVRTETERHLYRYRANPREYESSEGYFRVLLMAVVLYEDFGVRYNPERMTAAADDGFFADSRDIFLHGLVQVQSPRSKVQSLSSPSPSPLPEERVPPLNPQRSTVNRPLGTCSSMPVLYAAIGRRLGYPLKLATTKAHMFLRWEGGGERFDLEATGKGMNRYDDEHFKQWPFPVTEDEIKADGYLKSLSPAEELALFLSLRGHCLDAAGRMPEAVASYASAMRLAPESRPFRLLHAAAVDKLHGYAVPQVAAGAVLRARPPMAQLPPAPAPLSDVDHPPDPNPLSKVRQPW